MEAIKVRCRDQYDHDSALWHSAVVFVRAHRPRITIFGRDVVPDCELPSWLGFHIILQDLPTRAAVDGESTVRYVVDCGRSYDVDISIRATLQESRYYVTVTIDIDRASIYGGFSVFTEGIVERYYLDTLMATRTRWVSPPLVRVSGSAWFGRFVHWHVPTDRGIVELQEVESRCDSVPQQPILRSELIDVCRDPSDVGWRFGCGRYYFIEAPPNYDVYAAARLAASEGFTSITVRRCTLP